jgi:hypothetical protein
MRKDILEKKDLILEMIKQNRPKIEIAKKLGCKQHTLNVYLEKMGICYTGNIGLKGIKKCSFRKNAMYYIANDIQISSNRLKKKLIEDGIKEHKCESCELTKWLDEPIPLELHHIDGNSYNNKLDNLTIICPNCHYMTHNYSGRKTKIKISKTRANPKLCECGIDINKKSKMCKSCYHRSSRLVERPNIEQLLFEISESSYLEVGKKYGVSDNSIRKWLRNFKKEKD